MPNQSIIIPGVRFNLKAPNQKEATLIYAAYRYDGKKLVYSTKHKIKPSSWDKRKQLPRINYKYYEELKEDLDLIQKSIVDVYRRNEILSLTTFKEILDLRLGRIIKEVNIKDTFIGFIDYYISKRRVLNDVRENTIKKYVSVRNKLEAYSIHIDKVLKFEDIDLNFKDDFLAWLYNNTSTKSQNTANKYFATIKLLLKKAFKQGFHSNNIYNDEDFNVKRVKTSTVALTEDEVQAILDLKNIDEELLKINKISLSFAHKVKDWFLVACYSSLRWSDFTNITQENIVNFKGDYYIQMWTHKTDEEVVIPINKDLLPILEKYNYMSPTMSSQRFNEAIKVICEMAGITNNIIVIKNEKGNTIKQKVQKCLVISSHTGRRTWASINYGKFPTALLMQCTGHTKESTFLSYIGLSKKDQALELMRRMKEDINQKK